MEKELEKGMEKGLEKGKEKGWKRDGKREGKGMEMDGKWGTIYLEFYIIWGSYAECTLITVC